VASARTVAVAASLAALLGGCSLGAGIHAGTKIPLAGGGQAPGFAPGPTIRAAIAVPNREHWITTEVMWREQLPLFGRWPVQFQSDPTFLIGYEHRLRLNPEYATALVFGGALGTASDIDGDVGGHGATAAAHVGYHHPFTPWLALHATVRARYLTLFRNHTLFLELPVVLTAEF
jgi:hypothetical protein